MWAVVAGIGTLQSQDVVKKILKDDQERLSKGVTFYLPSKGESVETLKKREKIGTRQAEFLKKCSAFLNLEEHQCWQLFCDFLVNGYRGSTDTLQHVLASEQHTQNLLYCLLSYYYHERLTLLLIIKHVLAHSTDESHPYQSLYKEVKKECFSCATFLETMIEQLEALIKEVPPQKQKTDQTLWPWFNLRLISESLQILLLMFVRPEYRHGGTQKHLLRLLKIFQHHSFGARGDPSWGLRLDMWRPLSDAIGFLEALILLQLLQLEHLRDSDGKFQRHPMTQEVQLWDKIRKSLESLGGIPCHVIPLLGCVLVSFSAHGTESSAVGKVARALIYALVNELLACFHEDSLGSLLELAQVFAALLSSPNLAEDFWRVLRDESAGTAEGESLGAGFENFMSLFPYHFQPLIITLEALASSGTQSAHRVISLMQKLPCMAQSFLTVPAASIIPVVGERRQWEIRDALSPYPGCRGMSLPPGIQGDIPEHCASLANPPIIWHATVNGWQILLCEIQALIQQTALHPESSFGASGTHSPYFVSGGSEGTRSSVDEGLTPCTWLPHFAHFRPPPARHFGEGGFWHRDPSAILEEATHGGVAFILEKVFPSFHEWHFEEAREQGKMGMLCLSLCLKLLKWVEEQRTPIHPPHRIVLQALLQGRASHTLLRILSTNDVVLERAFEEQSDWEHGKGVDLMQLLEMALRVLSSLISIRLLLTKKILVVEGVDLSANQIPLDAVLCLQPETGELPPLPLGIARYLYHRIHPVLPTLALETLTHIARAYPMSLLACLGAQASIIRDQFLRRITSQSEDIQLRICGLEFLTTCVALQPGLLQIFLQVDSEDSIYPLLKGILAQLAQGEGECSQNLALGALKLLSAFWSHSRIVPVQTLQEDSDFWPNVTAIFASDPRLDGASHSLMAASVFTIVGMELYLRNEALNTQMADQLKALLKEHLLKWSQAILRQCTLELSSGDLALLTAWKNFLLQVLCQGNEGKLKDVTGLPNWAGILSDILESLAALLKSMKEGCMSIRAPRAATHLALAGLLILSSKEGKKNCLKRGDMICSILKDTSELSLELLSEVSSPILSLACQALSFIPGDIVREKKKQCEIFEAVGVILCRHMGTLFDTLAQGKGVDEETNRVSLAASLLSGLLRLSGNDLDTQVNLIFSKQSLLYAILTIIKEMLKVEGKMKEEWKDGLSSLVAISYHLLSCHKMSFSEVLTFAAVFQDVLASLLNQLDVGNLKLTLAITSFLSLLSNHKAQWWREHPLCLDNLLREVGVCVERCVVYLLHPGVLQMAIGDNVDEKGRIRSMSAGSTSSSAPFQPLEMEGSDPLRHWSPKLLSTMQQLFMVLSAGLSALRKFGPSLEDFLGRLVLEDVSQWVPILSTSFATPSLSWDSSDGVTGDTSLSFGTILGAATACIRVLPKCTAEGVEGEMRGRVVVSVLEQSLSLALSQALLILSSPNQSSDDQQFICRELGAELNSIRSSLERYVRRSLMSPKRSPVPSGHSPMTLPIATQDLLNVIYQVSVNTFK
ncbi:unnamed protein product [Darwinula stevensoni]|uniref:Nucleoporin NUP188 n=1 Tax=Darwinula stevensoni TaxID=69355 RepID=A0A7R9A6N3_9CRUS|nr:unnamed protein product [Darwinula stevensoni]CAG0888352.1 unnamed protein product [Darwinula stevensoni]